MIESLVLLAIIAVFLAVFAIAKDLFMALLFTAITVIILGIILNFWIGGLILLIIGAVFLLMVFVMPLFHKKG